MRTAVLALSLAAIAAPAFAQNWEAERARMQAETMNQQAQQEAQANLDRQNYLASQREAYAERDRMRSEVTLQQLENQRYRDAARQGYRPADTRAAAAYRSSMAADAARMDAITDRLLAESNARVRAVKPASDPR